MHIVTFCESMLVGGMPVKERTSYLMNSTGLGSLLLDRTLVKCRDGHMRPKYRLIEVAPTWIFNEGLHPGGDYNGRTIWLFRSGGFGDMLLMTPTIREIRQRWPESRVNVVTMPEYGPVFRGLVGVEVWTGLLPTSEIGGQDVVVFFEGVIEDNPAARVTHAVELFAERAGLVPLSWMRNEAMRLSYEIHPAEREWARSKFPRMGRRRVGIQALPSAAARSYPAQLLVQVIQELTARDIEVYIFGKPGQVELEGLSPLVTNLCDVVDEKGDGMTFRNSVAVLATCDVVVVPDSAFLHIAGAIGLPAVALFASFDASLRVIPGTPVKVLQGKADCAPCHWHESGKMQFPPGGPCQVAGCCSVLASITPARVVEAVMEWLVEWLVERPMKPEKSLLLGRVPNGPKVVKELSDGSFDVCDGITGETVARFIPGKDIDFSLPEGAHLAVAEIGPEVVVYDFKDHKIGDTVAAVYLLGLWKHLNPEAELHIIDRGALSVMKYFRGLKATFGPEMCDQLERYRRLNFEFGNLWIAAPSAFRDRGKVWFVPPWGSVDVVYDVGLHCLQDAEYNVARNHRRDQFHFLYKKLTAAGLKVFTVPHPKAGHPLGEIIDGMRRCRVWVGGDTGLTHLFAALHPDRELIAIYPDDAQDRAAFEEERSRMVPWWRPLADDAAPDTKPKMSSPWCSDPLVRRLRKYVMKGNRFNVNIVLKRILMVVNLKRKYK